jgi:hypothetical protein
MKMSGAFFALGPIDSDAFELEITNQTACADGRRSCPFDHPLDRKRRLIVLNFVTLPPSLSPSPRGLQR